MSESSIDGEQSDQADGCRSNPESGRSISPDILGSSSAEEECLSPEVQSQTPPSFNACSSNGRRQLFSDKRNPQLLILEELKKTNECIGGLSNRMDAIENRLKSVEQHQKEAVTPSSSSSVESKKRKVPAKIRVS